MQKTDRVDFSALEASLDRQTSPNKRSAWKAFFIKTKDALLSLD